MQYEQLKSMHWDIAMLLKMGVDPEFVSQMSAEQVRDTLKGLLYLHAKYDGSQPG